MSDHTKTKEQLLHEIEKLRLRLDKQTQVAAKHREAKKKALDVEKKYRNLFEHATDAIYLIDPETQRILDSNRKAAAVTGYPAKELKAMSVLDLHPTEEQDIVVQIFKKLSSAGSLTGISGIHQITKDGTLLPVEINASSIEIDGQKYCLAIIRDISERTQALSELKKSEQKYRALFKHMFIGCALHKIIVDKNNRPVDYLFLEINDSFERLTGMSKATIIGKKVTEIIPDIKKEKPDLIKIYGDVALKGEAAKFELQFKPFNKWYSVSAYSPMEGYFVSLFDDITLRKYWEGKLRESEEKYRSLFERANDSIFIIDPGTRRFIDANENAAKRVGYTRKELLQLTVDDINTAMPAERNNEIVRELYKTRSVLFEHKHRRKDGSELHVEVSSRLVQYGDKKVIESFVRDITERKKAEEILYNSEKRLRDISENALVWIWEVDAQGRYTYTGSLVEQILGYRPEEIMGKYFYDFFHPDDRKELKKAAFDVFAAKKPFREFTNRNIHKSGRTIWLSTSGVPITDKEGNLLGYRGADADVTVRKENEERLIRSEDEWKATFDTIPDLILITDKQHKIVKTNKSLADKLGCKREELLGRSCYEVIHGTSKPPTYCPHVKTIADGKEHTQEVYEDELKGHYLVSASPIYDSHNNPVGVVEVARDITERKKLEERLQEEAITDQLTGLFNRRGFHTFASQQLKLAKRKKRKVSLVYLDLDNMKEINDELGHHEGDNALKDTATILKKTFRESDLIGRIGGDEFAVLLPEHSSSGIKDVITKHVQEKVKIFNGSHNRTYTLHISIGVAEFNPDNPCSIEELMEQADTLMYEVKKQKIGNLKKSSAEYTEKRLYHRYKPGDDYWARVGSSQKSKIIDISLGGMCLRTLKRLSASSRHDIKIASPDKKEIKSSGKVVRSQEEKSKNEKDKGSSHFLTALKFDDKNERFNKSLERFIENLVK